ncbi:xanthine dehydrogenase/oxidase-like [Patella vulgata]|uniref:xanthine dehydrogenase/oxidase-like n=1 Tax=Patella vulgata TaxID=6465 RepID=UPI0024A9DD74|nr:xanthine dehydrogenase/oxidase-like [Patella vulgata]
MPVCINSARPDFVQCPVCHASHSPVKGELKDGVYAADCQNCGHFFKFRAAGPFRSTFSVTINGQSYPVDNSYPGSTSLNEFLRQKGISPGTKVMCIEGGCGVCVVSATIMDPVTSKPRTYAVNSCCVPLLQCDGWDITTIEGLGNTRDGINPIQQRLADYNGTQCGFCSPAQVMSMNSLLKTNPKPTMEEVEQIMDSTVCRCTGYRSILDAMKSFAADAGPDLPGGLIDIEDLECMIL